MAGKAKGRLRPRADYSSPSTCQHSQQRLKKFIWKKQQAEMKKTSLSVFNLPNIDIPPTSRMLSISKPTTLSISPALLPINHLPDLSLRSTPHQQQPQLTRPQVKARRRIPPPMTTRVTHCCVCWQEFTSKSPEFHCICGSIPCLDCLGYHTCPS